MNYGDKISQCRPLGRSNLGRNNPSCLYPSLDDSFFEKIDSPNKAYVLGWIASDGTITKDYRTTSIVLAEQDLEILEKIRDIVCKKVPIRQHKVYRALAQNQYRLNICSKTIGKRISKLLGLSRGGKKSGLIRFPKLEKRYESDFIRGVFDGDGNIRSIDKNSLKGLECGISSYSMGLKEGIKEICFKNGIDSHINKYGIYFSTYSAIKFLSFLYDNGKIRLKRKYKMYRRWKKRIESKNTYMCEQTRR
jgi:hypothetical protein